MNLIVGASGILENFVARRLLGLSRSIDGQKFRYWTANFLFEVFEERIT